jgi:transposase
MNTDMAVVHERCAALDVHKKTVTVCARRVDPGGRVQHEVAQFGTMTRELLALGDWMRERGVTQVAMESTGVFWKPIWNVLEGQFTLMVCNAQHVKQVPGRKTDITDCEWLAQLLQYGLLRGSFVPPRPLRELRDLTRLRAQFTSDRTRVCNRIAKVLEDANIKLGAVASDLFGVSGRSMLESMIAGDSDPEALAELARRRLRGKIPQLREALYGRITEHHRFLLRTLYAELTGLERGLEALNEQIMQAVAAMPANPDEGEDAASPGAPGSEAGAVNPETGECLQDTPAAPLSFPEALVLIDEVPGIEQTSAQNILAELGVRMEQFPSADHAASWAGLCPGNNESAGKRKSGKTTKGNRWLRRALTQSAWAASRKKGSYFAALYRRIAARRGKKRAIVAVAHALLCVVYHMLKTHSHYYELGADYFDQLHPEATVRYHTRRLQQMGYEVILQPKAAA